MDHLRLTVVAVVGALLTSGLTMAACSSEPSSAAATPAAEGGPSETGVLADAPPDVSDGAVSKYSADDLTKFQYKWHGTGISGDFAIDSDCGVTSKGALGFAYDGPTVNGVAPAAECEAFKSLAMSAPVIEAMGRKRTMVCTDDYPSITVTLVDGGKLTSEYEQCTTDEPYKTLLPKMDALRKSVPASDAATDGG